jgi:F-type H+-transporting ATPase subunit delta
MSDFRIAHRYANALFGLALERKELDAIHADMLLVKKTSEENRELKLLLRNPIVSPLVKQKIVKKVFEKHVSALVVEFIGLVMRKNRSAFLILIAEQFHAMFNEHQGIEDATVITPIRLDKALQDSFIQYIKDFRHLDIRLTEKVEPELIGGFVIKSGDVRIDTSVKTRLAKLKRELTDSTFVKNL